MSEIKSFRAIVELWPSREAMAADVGARANTVSRWWQRRSIPVEWWSAVLGTKCAVDAGLTAELLTELAAREHAEAGA